MSIIGYAGDYRGDAVRLAMSQFQRAPRVSALLRALAGAGQTMEDAAFDVLVTDSPEDAGGITLDRWGRIVGQPRRGLTDAEYRRFIQARINANISGSDVETLVSLWAEITSPAEVQHFRLHGGLALVSWRASPMRGVLRGRVREFMRAVQPAGLGLVMLEAGPVPAAFRYDDGPGLDAGEFARLL